ncbi:serine/threonine protein kinase [Pseudoramibacter faecis]|uniref:serine/threonine protein kinase n=1 Tax=Pseudoramibacter faecis TaxID=3108534 RepID=UPI002E77B0C7|nr:protein kinase [Pseudoramibacter sp. HA2172]
MDRRTRCEQSFYKPLYHFEATGQILLIDETTDALLLQKRLRIYNEKVYAYLKAHPHPNLARVKSYWQEEDGSLTVIETYAAGRSLADCLPELDPQTKAQVIADVCAGLIFLHEASPAIVHRDVKPANIIVTPEGRAVLVDYDAAKQVRAGKARDTVLLGTEGAAAPEQYGFGASDTRTDVFGVGMLIRALFPEAPIWQKIADKATQMDPKDRYPDVAALQTAIRRRLWWRSLPMPAVTPMKMAAALPYYALAIAGGLTSTFEGAKTAGHLWFNRIGGTIILLGMLEIIFAWLPGTRRLPWRSSTVWWQRLLAVLGYSAVLPLAGILGFVILEAAIF